MSKPCVWQLVSTYRCTVCLRQQWVHCKCQCPYRITTVIACCSICDRCSSIEHMSKPCVWQLVSTYRCTVCLRQQWVHCKCQCPYRITTVIACCSICDRCSSIEHMSKPGVWQLVSTYRCTVCLRQQWVHCKCQCPYRITTVIACCSICDRCSSIEHMSKPGVWQLVSTYRCTIRLRQQRVHCKCQCPYRITTVIACCSICDRCSSIEHMSKPCVWQLVSTYRCTIRLRQQWVHCKCQCPYRITSLIACCSICDRCISIEHMSKPCVWQLVSTYRCTVCLRQQWVHCKCQCPYRITTVIACCSICDRCSSIEHMSKPGVWQLVSTYRCIVCLRQQWVHCKCQCPYRITTVIACCSICDRCSSIEHMSKPCVWQLVSTYRCTIRLRKQWVHCKCQCPYRITTVIACCSICDRGSPIEHMSKPCVWQLV